MRVLITNIEMKFRSGTTLYARDLALELMRQGHQPAIFTLVTGGIADELRQAGIQVETCLKRFQIQPDIIHGHHNTVTNAALQFYQGVHALYICHDHIAMIDEPPIHPRIHSYCAVSKVCAERVRLQGIPEKEIIFLPNFVDIQRFRIRPPLPRHPRRALLFSNYANISTHLPAVQEACRQTGLELDIIGMGVGHPVERPEDILGNYDIVFAKAKAAMEAMAVGAAVILCDFSGVGPLVTSQEFAALQPFNFGFQALRNPLAPEHLVKQIARYDAEDAASVRDLLRSNHRLDETVQKLVVIYGQLINAQSSAGSEPDVYNSFIHRFKVSISLRLQKLNIAILPLKRTLFKSMPGYSFFKRVFWCLMRMCR